MIKTQSTIYQHSKGDTFYLTIPSKMAMDSAFPFKPGDRVTIEVQYSKDFSRPRQDKAWIKVEKLE